MADEHVHVCIALRHEDGLASLEFLHVKELVTEWRNERNVHCACLRSMTACASNNTFRADWSLKLRSLQLRCMESGCYAREKPLVQQPPTAGSQLIVSMQHTA